MSVYSEVLRSIERLSKRCEIKIIGKSVLGREIYAVNFGKEPKTMFFGSIHAREHITARLLCALAESYNGDDVAVVPLLNVDGVRLCDEGILTAPKSVRKYLTQINGGSEDFSLWKANINAVDLNVNFDADWGKGKSNRFKPSPESYIGPYPFSEPESRAIRDFALDKDFVACYHCKGEVIYYGWRGEEGLEQARILKDKLGYPIERSIGSAGGFKDWFLENGLGISYTIEVASDSLNHPIKKWVLPALIKRHEGIFELCVRLKNDGYGIHESCANSCKRGGGA
ncbi:MAG: hypothetical protein GX891_03370 [Clostridiales bacterium]|nr:hypothetical protein [Clostridiales bacterium]